MKILSFDGQWKCNKCKTTIEIDSPNDVEHEVYKTRMNVFESVTETLCSGSFKINYYYEDAFIICPICKNKIYLSHNEISEEEYYKYIRNKK